MNDCRIDIDTLFGDKEVLEFDENSTRKEILTAYHNFSNYISQSCGKNTKTLFDFIVNEFEEFSSDPDGTIQNSWALFDAIVYKAMERLGWSFDDKQELRDDIFSSTCNFHDYTPRDDATEDEKKLYETMIEVYDDNNDYNEIIRTLKVEALLGQYDDVFENTMDLFTDNDALPFDIDNLYDLANAIQFKDYKETRQL
ncbi:hypothetical protein HpHNI20_13430 [Helicobacter pylori]